MVLSMQGIMEKLTFSLCVSYLILFAGRVAMNTKRKMKLTHIPTSVYQRKSPQEDSTVSFEHTKTVGIFANLSHNGSFPYFKS